MHWVLLHQYQVYSWHAQCVDAVNRCYSSKFCSNRPCCAAVCIYTGGCSLVSTRSKVWNQELDNHCSGCGGQECGECICMVLWLMLFSGP